MHLFGDNMVLLFASVILNPSVVVILTRKKILTGMTRLGGGYLAIYNIYLAI